MNKAIIYAILAALFYSISIPINEILLEYIPKASLSGFLYLGAGLGILITYLILKIKKISIKEESLNKKDTPYVILMIILDIIAPICLIWGLSISTSSNVSLLNNFEIVATTLIALIFFKEKVSLKLWIGIILIIVSSSILSINFEQDFNINYGSLLVILACLFWGIENNCTRQISDKNSYQIVILKGLFSGIGSIFVGMFLQETITNYIYIIYALILGFFAYGLSVFLYVKAQNKLGAAKTSAFYSLAPFMGVLLSIIILGELPKFTFYIALIIMALSMIFIIKDKFEGEKHE